jgi:hypothetical protein
MVSLIYKGEYSSLYPEIMNGKTYYYRKNAELVERGYFTNGYPDSLWVCAKSYNWHF